MRGEQASQLVEAFLSVWNANDANGHRVLDAKAAEQTTLGSAAKCFKEALEYAIGLDKEEERVLRMLDDVRAYS